MDNNPVFNLQQDIVNLILDKLEREEITVKKAAAIARYVNSVLNNSMTQEQLANVVADLDKKYPELLPVVSKFLSDKDIKDKQQGLTEVQNIINQT